jgi:hypothetical protein
MDPHRAAVEAEADRLFGVFIRIKTLAQSRRISFDLAGEEAVRNGLISEADWLTIKQI